MTTAMIPAYSMMVQNAMLKVLNNKSHDCLLSCPHVTLDAASFSVGLQEGVDAIVIHLLPDGTHDVLLVNQPRPDAIRRMKDLCVHMTRAWGDVGWKSSAAFRAAYELAGYEAAARIKEAQCV
jgi:hypothetical protein